MYMHVCTSSTWYSGCRSDDALALVPVSEDDRICKQYTCTARHGGTDKNGAEKNMSLSRVQEQKANIHMNGQ